MVIPSQETDPPESQIFDPSDSQSLENIYDNIVDNLSYWDNIELTPVEEYVGRGRGRSRLRGKGRGRGKGSFHQPIVLDHILETQPSQHVVIRRRQRNGGETTEMQPNEPLDLVLQQPNEPPFSQNTQPEPFIRKRIPKSTHRRKGLLKPTSVGGENYSSIGVVGDERSNVAMESNLGNESNDDNAYNPCNSRETDETESDRLGKAKNGLKRGGQEWGQSFKVWKWHSLS
ncbi:hypothetical protein BVRB_6g140990 [Beta vulgaris subsp. vulgaris]|nr:hypothetical protein BVRB_6g140990 [Beta vulgaris subsp. vulgaris]